MDFVVQWNYSRNGKELEGERFFKTAKEREAFKKSLEFDAPVFTEFEVEDYWAFVKEREVERLALVLDCDKADINGDRALEQWKIDNGYLPWRKRR